MHYGDDVDHDDPIIDLWKTLDGKNAWCNGSMPRPTPYNTRRHDKYDHCDCAQQLMVPVLDDLAIGYMYNRFLVGAADDNNGRVEDLFPKLWSAVYASLPVTRVTMLREPFSWLISKFFWHGRRHQNATCDNIQQATTLLPAGATSGGRSSVAVDEQQHENDGHLLDADTSSGGFGWVRTCSLEYILQLCGEDCVVRYKNGQASLEQITIQAEYNLRYGFAVVGLLEEDQEIFFDMITARVDYMNTSRNADLHGGGKHKSKKRHDERDRCKARFGQVDFRQELLSKSPETCSIGSFVQCW